MQIVSHLFVLIGGDSDELGLLEHERVELAPWQLDDVVLLDDVEARLVLVHRVEYGLRVINAYKYIQAHAEDETGR